MPNTLGSFGTLTRGEFGNAVQFGSQVGGIVSAGVAVYGMLTDRTDEILGKLDRIIKEIAAFRAHVQVLLQDLRRTIEQGFFDQQRLLYEQDVAGLTDLVQAIASHRARGTSYELFVPNALEAAGRRTGYVAVSVQRSFPTRCLDVQEWGEQLFMLLAALKRADRNTLRDNIDDAVSFMKDLSAAALREVGLLEGEHRVERHEIRERIVDGPVVFTKFWLHSDGQTVSARFEFERNGQRLRPEEEAQGDALESRDRHLRPWRDEATRIRTLAANWESRVARLFRPVIVRPAGQQDAD